MAVVKMEIICRDCGKEFVHRRECRNCSEAESYKVWAKEHVDTCPECLRKQQREAMKKNAVALLERYGMALPEITEGTEKQIAYASGLRAEYITHNSTAEKYCAVVALLRDERDRVEQEAAAHGKTADELWADFIARQQVKAAHIALTSTSAREIIDVLK